MTRRKLTPAQRRVLRSALKGDFPDWLDTSCEPRREIFWKLQSRGYVRFEQAWAYNMIYEVVDTVEFVLLTPKGYAALGMQAQP